MPACTQSSWLMCANHTAVNGYCASSTSYMSSSANTFATSLNIEKSATVIQLLAKKI